jgi:hypothetical protein
MELCLKLLLILKVGLQFKLNYDICFGHTWPSSYYCSLVKTITLHFFLKLKYSSILHFRRSVIKMHSFKNLTIFTLLRRPCICVVLCNRINVYMNVYI